MDVATTILGGFMIAILSGIVGKAIGSSNNVKVLTCSERQLSCQKLVTEKIDHLTEKIDDLAKAINSRIMNK